MRSAARVGGAVLIAVGILAVAWGFVTWRWNDPVTAVYAGWKQHQLADTYEERVAQRFALPAAAARPTTSPEQREKAVRTAAARLRKTINPGEPIGRIRVPRLGLNMVLVSGTDTASLRRGPGLDRRTFMPGEGQLVYIAGHRTTYLAPFARIDQLRPGDRVTLTMPYATITYRVTRHVIVPADDIGRLRSTGEEVVALQACHPRFSARERYIVYAKPVSIQPVSARTSKSATAATTRAPSGRQAALRDNGGKMTTMSKGS